MELEALEAASPGVVCCQILPMALTMRPGQDRRAEDRRKKERERRENRSEENHSEEKELTFTKQSENFQNQKKDGLSLDIITLGHIIHWKNS